MRNRSLQSVAELAEDIDLHFGQLDGTSQSCRAVEHLAREAVEVYIEQMMILHNNDEKQINQDLLNWFKN